METDSAFGGRSRSRSFVADDELPSSSSSSTSTTTPAQTETADVAELPPFEGRTRSRSRSFRADSEEELTMEEPPRNRGRSRSFYSTDDTDNDSEIDSASNTVINDVDDEDGSGEGAGNNVAARAASLSKIYLAGSAPVDAEAIRKHKKKKGKRETKVPTGALSAKALDTLSAGLQHSAQITSSNRSPTSKPSEEEIEEEKLAKQEAEALYQGKSVVYQENQAGHGSTTVNKNTITAASSRAMAFASKGAASLRSSLFSRKLGLGGNTTEGGDSSKDDRSGGEDITDDSDSVHDRDSSGIFNVRKRIDNRNSGSNASDKSKGGEQAVSALAAAAAVNGSKIRKKHKLKLLLLGDSGVGKTSLMRVMSGSEFSESMLATAGVDFKLRHITIGGEDVALQIWDTAGQERFHRITAAYYKGADGIILVYDVNERKTFNNVDYWMNNIQQNSTGRMPAMLLVGNKIDLENPAVSSEEGAEACSKYNCRFIETSAKTSHNTEESLETVARDSLFLSINPNMTQKELIEKERKYGRVKLMKDQCCIS